MPTSFPGTIPVRIELHVGLNVEDGPICGFTVHHPFNFQPSQGDGVIFGEDDPHVAEVVRCLHYDGLKPEVLVLTKPYVCENYEDMLRILDWFKSRYEIENLSANESPEPYYVLYRTIIDLLEIKEDAPCIPYEQRPIKIIAETIRTIYIAEWIGDIDEDRKAIQPNTIKGHIEAAIGASADETMQLMQAILSMKQPYPDAAPLLQIARFWDKLINDRGTDKKWTWNVPRERCVEVGGYIFEKTGTEGVPFLIQS